MDIAVQVSPQKDSKEIDEQTTVKLSVENQLILELENMFKRENLQNNSYLIYRMSNTLETPFDVIINEYKIKSISQDRNQIISALHKTKNLNVDDENKHVTPIIPTLQNKIIISNIENGEEEDLKKFLIQGVEDKDCEFVFDRKNCCRVVFKDEIKTKNFFDWISNKTFKNRRLYPYYEPENLYITFLQNIQEKKHFNKNDFSTHSMPYYGAGMPVYPVYPDPDMYSMMDPSYMMYPPYGFDPYRFMPPPYYTNFFIRKANDNDEEKSEEDYDDGYYKKKHYEKKDKYYQKDYNYGGNHYKQKHYNKEYDKGGYYGKNNSYNNDNRTYEHSSGDKNKSNRDNRDNYKERKGGYNDYSKKNYYKDKKTHTPNQKYYYEPKQMKDDTENFPPLIVKEEKKIEVTVQKPEPEENKQELVDKTGSSNSYTRKQIVEIFQKLKTEKRIMMNPALEKTHEDVFHLVERDGDIRLEFLDPKSVKIPTSTNTTPLMTGMSRPPVIMEEKKE